MPLRIYNRHGLPHFLPSCKDLPGILHTNYSRSVGGAAVSLLHGATRDLRQLRTSTATYIHHTHLHKHAVTHTLSRTCTTTHQNPCTHNLATQNDKILANSRFGGTWFQKDTTKKRKQRKKEDTPSFIRHGRLWQNGPAPGGDHIVPDEHSMY